MAEVTAIVNARPLVPVSSDPESPLILTPSMLLTQKICTPASPLGEFVEESSGLSQPILGQVAYGVLKHPTKSSEMANQKA